jgi:hypothetical protein
MAAVPRAARGYGVLAVKPNDTPSQSPLEGAGLQGSEQRIQLGEVGAHSGLLPFHGFDDGGEAVLECKWRAASFDR